MIIDTSKLKLADMIDYEFYLLRKVKAAVGNRILTDKGDFITTYDESDTRFKEGDELIILEQQLTLRELKQGRKKALQDSPELVYLYDEDIKKASESYQGSKLVYGLIHSNTFIDVSEFIDI